MRALVVEREPDTDRSSQALALSGVEVVRCRPEGSHAPCAGLPGGDGCPLDRAPVDVAVAWRGDGGPGTDDEMGMNCAIRLQIPTVVVGHRQGASYASHVRAEVAPDDPALAETITAIAATALDPVADAARAAVLDVFARHDLAGANLEVEVTRPDDRLVVAARTDVPLDKHVAQTAAVRAVAAVRQRAPHLARIDIAVSGTPTTP